MPKSVTYAGFILAAGEGTRLKPLTERVPKPLLPAGRGVMMDRAIEWLVSAGVQRIVINTWYKKNVICSYVEHIKKRLSVPVFTSSEAYLMGTGGGLLNALKLFEEDAVIVHNSDVISDVEPNRLKETFESHSHPVCLVCVPHVKGTTSLFMAENRVYLFDPPEDKKCVRVTYTGIAVFDASFLRTLPQGKGGLVEKVILPSQERHGPPVGILHTGQWCDGGTPEGYRCFQNIVNHLQKN